MQTSDDINELAAALAKAQSDFPDINKGQTATIKGKDKNGNHFEYKYKYADLADILKAATPVLSKNELTVTQMVDSTESGNLVLRTTLAHSSGQYMQGTMPVGFQGGDPKALGSMLTYYRRYSFTALVGICADEDDDANAAGTHERSSAENSSTKAKSPANRKRATQTPSKASTTSDDHQAALDSVPFKRSDGKTIQIKPSAAVDRLWEAHKSESLSDQAFFDLLEGNRSWMQGDWLGPICRNMRSKPRKTAA